MRTHLIDGTYELFRAYFGAPRHRNAEGVEVGATRGFLMSMASLVQQPDVTHVACAFDTVIRSFRNDLFPAYKTEDGVPAELLAQFPMAEHAARALGIVVWPMIPFEADDALATAAARFADERDVEQVIICTPDKDLAQCVRGREVVLLDRMRKRVLDEEGVVDKFGVAPPSIPDWLALVGDTADGIPGIPRFGALSAAAVLRRYQHLENIPARAMEWDVLVRGKTTLAENLSRRFEDAMLYRTLATLRRDVPLTESLEDLAWRGLRQAELASLCEMMGLPEVISTTKK